MDFDKLPIESFWQEYAQGKTGEFLNQKNVELLTAFPNSNGNRERIIKEIVINNLGLALKVARQHYHAGLHHTFEDLVDYGVEGLIKAIKKFDLSRGTKFSTHATWWIRSAITKAIKYEDKEIRLSEHAIKKVNKLKETEKELVQTLGKDPSITEIAVKMGLPTKEIQSLKEISKEPIYLSTPVGEEGYEFEEFIEDREAKELIDIALSSITSKKLQEKIDELLSEREQEVIWLFAEGYKDTEIKKRFGVTAQRIGVIRRESFKKLEIPELRALVDEEIAV